MRSRAFRPVAAMLCILLLAAVPVHAGSIAVSDVLQVLGNYQNPVSLRLRTPYERSNAVVSGTGGATNGGSLVTQQMTNHPLNGSGSSKTDPRSDTLLSGITTANDERSGVNVVDQGDVEGTICDCGEIELAGGFPKWPLLFLTGIPLFFIQGSDTPPPTLTPTPTPTPSGPTPSPVPEPATLLLFGTGLVAIGARLRRRPAKLEFSGRSETSQEG